MQHSDRDSDQHTDSDLHSVTDADQHANPHTVTGAVHSDAKPDATGTGNLDAAAHQHATGDQHATSNCNQYQNAHASPSDAYVHHSNTRDLYARVYVYAYSAWHAYAIRDAWGDTLGDA